MSANLIANRYAKAILGIVGSEAASASKFLNFLELANQLYTIPESRKVLRSPVMPAEVKRDLLNFVANKADTADQAQKFVEQLVQGGRVGLIPEIYNAYRRMLDEKRGIAHATITTAQPLPESEKKQLQDTLSKVFKKNLTVDNKTNPKVLGGLVVEVGNFSLDLSVRAKLDSLAERART